MVRVPSSNPLRADVSEQHTICNLRSTLGTVAACVCSWALAVSRMVIRAHQSPAALSGLLLTLAIRVKIPPKSVEAKDTGVEIIY